MLFNSVTFLGFFAVVYVGYLLLGRWLSVQNAFLLAASLFFYGYWDYRFLILMAVSILSSYWAARSMAGEVKLVRRRRLVWVAVALNLTVLGFFKYFGFFVETTQYLLSQLGMQPDPLTLQVILPVGISFYTFQALSYVVDVYRRELEPVRSLVNFGLYICFFPQLVAGPIERAQRLLAQIEVKRRISPESVNAGLFLILAGYFKKVVIADNLALTADSIFDDYQRWHGVDTLVGMLAFTVQIYCDFSGYSDIARGLAKLMGFELMLNFNLPYFAKSPSDFWQRWHISLSSWLRDYLYIPLGGNKRGQLLTYRNLMLTMVLGGLWHGAAWNFVLWGIYHGVILCLFRLIESRLPYTSSPGPFTRIAPVALMFTLTVAGWVIFRAHSLEQAWGMFSHVGWSWSKHSAAHLYTLALFSLPLLLIQLWQYRSRDLLVLLRLPWWMTSTGYAVAMAAIVALSRRESMEFIYFQF